MRKIGILRKLHLKLCFLIRRTRWSMQAQKVRRKITRIEQIITFDTNKKVMIILPHSDDEWIGCSQIIKNWNNVILCNTDMQGGDDESMHIRRREELRNTGLKYNRPLILTSVNDLATTINTEKPDAICIPYYIDWHDEHIAVLKAIYESINDLDVDISVVSYQVSVPMTEKMVNFVIPMSKKEHKNKWKYFKNNYKTQTIIPYQRFAYNETINSAMTGNYAVEAYRVLNIKEWGSEFIKYYLSKEESVELIMNLNDLCDIREVTKRIIREKEARQ